MLFLRGLQKKTGTRRLVPRWLGGLKNLPAVQETQETGVWSLGQEDPLEEGTATHASILAWRIQGTEEAGTLQSMDLRVRHNRGSWACTHACARNLPSLRSLLPVFFTGNCPSPLQVLNVWAHAISIVTWSEMQILGHLPKRQNLGVSSSWKTHWKVTPSILTSQQVCIKFLVWASSSARQERNKQLQ